MFFQSWLFIGVPDGPRWLAVPLILLGVGGMGFAAWAFVERFL